MQSCCGCVKKLSFLNTQNLAATSPAIRDFCERV
jgi:hypothetical protein